jgi:hypothetical protein
MAKDKNHWGLAASTAREMLAKAGEKSVMVRTKNKDDSLHAGRALLLSVINDRTACIKPLQGHKKTEDVPLSTLKLWRSANELNGVHVPMSTAVAEPPVQKKVSTQNFVIFSRSNAGVWAGENQKWSSNPLRGITYEEPNAKRACYALGRNADSNDCEVLSMAEAMTILGEMRGPATLPVPIENKIRPLAPSPTKMISQIPGMNFDIDAILNEDDSILATARARRKAAAQDVKDAQTLLSEAMQKLQDAQIHYENVMGRVQPGRISETVEPVEKAGKRENLREKVMIVLMESSRLSEEAIVDKVKGQLSSVNKGVNQSINRWLLRLESSGQAQKDESHNWSLTAKGRANAR